MYQEICQLLVFLVFLSLPSICDSSSEENGSYCNEFAFKRSAIFFAADITARGLDFLAVNWVLGFVHRTPTRKTCRYKENGDTLLILLPSEGREMVQQLLQKKVPVKKIKINPEKTFRHPEK